MILKIECANTHCGQDIVTYVDDFAGNMQLECIPCGSRSFIAYHQEEVNHSIKAIKEGLVKLKSVDYSDFESVLETVSEDFNSLLRRM